MDIHICRICHHFYLADNFVIHQFPYKKEYILKGKKKFLPREQIIISFRVDPNWPWKMLRQNDRCTAPASVSISHTVLDNYSKRLRWSKVYSDHSQSTGFQIQRNTCVLFAKAVNYTHILTLELCFHHPCCKQFYIKQQLI